MTASGDLGVLRGETGMLHRWLLLGTAFLIFVVFCVLVLQPGPVRFDLQIRAWFHELSSANLTAFFVFISQLGSWFVLLSMGVLLAIVIVNRHPEVRMLTITLYGAVALSAALKLAFHVSRPEPFFGLATPETHSFPSAHALVSCCFFSLIADIISRRIRHRLGRWCIWVIAGCMITAIGISRVYLGMQYPSSVLAGYAAAVIWLEFASFALGRMTANLDDREVVHPIH
jgi:membrane-associated phospholipid phosphatase